MIFMVPKKVYTFYGRCLLSEDFTIYRVITRILTSALWQRMLFLALLAKIAQSSQENTCARVSFFKKLQYRAQVCNFIKKETLAQGFSC